MTRLRGGRNGMLPASFRAPYRAGAPNPGKQEGPPTVTRNRRLRTCLVGTLAAGTLALSGCGAGQIAQTSHEGAAVNGSSAQIGDIVVRDMQVVYPRQPSSQGAVYAQGGAAQLKFGIVNEGSTADRLVRVSSPAATAVQVGGDASLPKDILLVGGGEGGTAPAGVRPTTIELTGLTAPIRAGVPVPITLTFERAGSTTVLAPVGSPPEGAAAGEPEREETKAEGGSEQAAPAGSEAAPQGGQGGVPAPAPGAPEGGN
jgi:periplasmic copper chaperone A